MKVHVDKYKAIVHFNDGSTVESPEYYIDIHCVQFAEQFIDDERYNGYKIEHRKAYEELDLQTKAIAEHPVHFPSGGNES